MKEEKNVQKKIFLIEKKPNLLNKKRTNPISTEKDLKKEEIPKIFQISLKPKENPYINIKNISKNSTINKKSKNTPFVPVFKNGKWSQKEDICLLKYIQQFGEGKWSTIERHFEGRNRKQIRRRYLCHLKNGNFLENNNLITINNNNKNFFWDDNLDKELIKQYFLNNKHWVKISQKIPGTTENSVKNRFYSLLRQKVNQSKKEYKFLYLRETLKSINKSHAESQKNSIKKIKSIFGEENISSYSDIYLDKKDILWTNDYFKEEFFTNKSKKKNYSVKILLEFLPDLLEDKGIDINDIIREINKRKNSAIQKIFGIVEKHYYVNSYLNLSLYPKINSDECSVVSLNSISTNASQISNSLLDMQTEKLAGLIKNMERKIMWNYFYQFRLNTIGK